MPFYIATVWRTNVENPGTDYPHVTHYRQILRGPAESPEGFRENILNESADDEITVGVISLSKDQSGRR